MSDRIVTGQNPASAAALARAIMVQLREVPSAAEAGVGGKVVGAAASSASQFPGVVATGGGGAMGDGGMMLGAVHRGVGGSV